jgi:protein-L-isoaspartate(D-aspartate) O-methyltransferase
MRPFPAMPYIENLSHMTATNLNYDQARYNMVEQQVRPWDVLDPRVLKVISRIPREHFAPAPHKALAYMDTRIPLAEFNGIAYTMMNPNVEGRVLQHLDIGEDDTVLEIGTGSGYLTACLAALGRHVDSVDINPAMTEMAEENLASLGVRNINLSTGDAAKGWDQKRFYDAIALTGSMPTIPECFKQSLKVGGRLFVITGNAPAMTAQLVTRLDKNDFTVQPLFETSIERLSGTAEAERFIF